MTLRRQLRHVPILGRPSRLLDVGAGPLVVCVSGVASTLTDWLLLAADLASDHRVIVYDRPGYAPEDRLRARRAELHEEARRALAVARWAQRTQPPGAPAGLTLIGHSMGAYVCEAAARLAPDVVDAIVLLDGSTLSEAGSEQRRSSARRSALLAPVIRSRSIIAAWHVLGSFAMWVGVRGRAEIWRRFPGTAAEFRAHSVLAATVRELLDFEHLADALAALRPTAPLHPGLRAGVYPAASFWPSQAPGAGERLRTWRLGLWDEQTWIDAVLAEARTISQEIDIDFSVITGSGHFVMIDQPHAVAARVRRIAPT